MPARHAAAATLLLLHAAACRAAVHLNVAYKTIANTSLLLDLWTPPDYPGGGANGGAPSGALSDSHWLCVQP